MLKYRYRFPISGYIGDENDKEAFKRETARQLNGPWGIYFCFDAEKHAERIEGVELNEDESGSLTSIDLVAYMELKEGAEKDLINAMNECCGQGLDASRYDEAEISDIETFEYLGMEGEIPKTLYHITERKDLSDIKEMGLIPGRGKNSYKDYYDHIYLTDKENLSAWLAVLPSNSDPVILEVDAENISGLEQGRIYGDRPYMEHHFGEYRTKDAIPASAVKEADIKGEFGKDVLTATTKQFDHAVSHVRERRSYVTDEDIEKAKNRTGRWMDEDFAEPINEALTGLERLTIMGATSKEDITDLLRERQIPELMKDLMVSHLAPAKSTTYILDTYDTWAEEVSGDFSESINQIEQENQSINK